MLRTYYGTGIHLVCCPFNYQMVCVSWATFMVGIGDFQHSCQVCLTRWIRVLRPKWQPWGHQEYLVTVQIPRNMLDLFFLGQMQCGAKSNMRIFYLTLIIVWLIWWGLVLTFKGWLRMVQLSRLWIQTAPDIFPVSKVDTPVQVLVDLWNGEITLTVGIVALECASPCCIMAIGLLRFLGQSVCQSTRGRKFKVNFVKEHIAILSLWW